VVVVPVSQVDRAKAFYAERLGFKVDHDTSPADGVRVVQLTPPGSVGYKFVSFSDPDGNGWAVQKIRPEEQT
jgi:predicted lactoylglutathione lyase